MLIQSGGSRREILNLPKKLRQRCNELRPLLNCTNVENTLDAVESLGKRSLQQLAIQHQVQTDSARDNADEIRTRLVDHMSSGGCQASGSGLCPSFQDEYQSTVRNDLETHILQFAAKKGSVRKKTLKRILKCRNVEFDEGNNIHGLRKVLRLHVTQLRKGKQPELFRNYRSELQSVHNRKLEEIRSNWPEPASMQQKEQCVRNFRAATSSESLREFTCACCAESVNCCERKVISVNDIDVNLMRDRTDRVFNASECIPPGPPFTEGPLANIQVDPSGVMQTEEGLSLQLCHRCSSALLRNKLPRLAVANLNVLGPVPQEMKVMTMVEEMLVARCRSKQCIVKLQDHRNDISLPSSQRGFKGHVIVYPQKIEELSTVLPPPIDDVVHPICVVFVGPVLPSQSWLKEKAYPLVVRREVVRQNLLWLKAHNPLYGGVEISEERLRSLPENDVLGYTVEHIQPSENPDSLGSRYDSNPSSETNESASPPDETSPVQFSNIVITDVDGNGSPKDLKAAALRHYKQGGAFLSVLHEPVPVNEFFNPSLLPMMYPTLFPYGIGGAEDKHRTNSISFENHVKHFLSLADRRFQEHYSFLFVAFNIIQRRKMLLHTSLKVKRSRFKAWANNFKDISLDAIKRVIARSSNGSYPTACDMKNRRC